jgi:hypothetical protein
MFNSSSSHRRLIGCVTAAALSAATSAARANVEIIPNFLSSITSSPDAVKIEDAIDSSIGVFRSLYDNNLTITVTFGFTPGAPTALLNTTQNYYDVPYSAYVNALKADSAAHPSDIALATAIANLSEGNDANGASDMALSGAQIAMLGLGAASDSDAVININSIQNFAFSRPVSDTQYDLVGGLEHELNEVLGGGGGGSTLNSIASSCANSFFCNKLGSLDLYRYSAPGVPSFSTSSTASAYFSIDGGRTNVVAFNQNPSGDFGDFAPSGTGAGQLIQNAFNSQGQDEAYTRLSPEYTMMVSIGFDGTVPEPSTWAMMLLGFAGLGFAGYRRAREPRAA